MTDVLERSGLLAWRAVRALVAASSIQPEFQVTAAQYLLVTCCNVPGALAARIYGCSKQAISKALRTVEDRRDDPHYDAELTRLERLIEGG